MYVMMIQTENKAVLLTEIASYLRPLHIYGKQYESVTILSDYVGVLIVEGRNGRFPVRPDRVRKMDQNGINELNSALWARDRLVATKKTANSLNGITIQDKKICLLLFK